MSGASSLVGNGAARRIFMRDFILPVSIGIYDFERAKPQRIVLNIDLYLDDQPVARDAIDAVLDYDFLRREITALVASQHFNLQETLVERIIDLCLAKACVSAARVSSAKPDIYPDCAAIGFELFKPRDRA